MQDDKLKFKIEEIATTCFAGLAMTPDQITAKAYPSITLRTGLVRGKQMNIECRTRNIEVGSGFSLSRE